MLIRHETVSCGCDASDVQPGTTLAPGCIWDANTSLLVAAFQAAGADLVAVEPAPDDLAALAAQMARLAERTDIPVTTGGVSVGEADHCKAALGAAQGETVVAGVAMKPGKPVTIGRLNGAVWIGLPGNPLSTSYLPLRILQSQQVPYSAHRQSLGWQGGSWLFSSQHLCRLIAGQTCPSSRGTRRRIIQKSAPMRFVHR